MLSLCCHRFGTGTNAPTPLLPVPFRGAPHGGREPHEDMLLLRRSHPALTNWGFHCRKEGHPLSLFPGLVPLDTMISFIRGADVYVSRTLKISYKSEMGDYGISFVRLYTHEPILEWISRNHLDQFYLGRIR